MSGKVRIPKEGDRVRIKSIDIKGKVMYVDQPSLYQHHMSPIQVTLDKPYEDDHCMYRTDLKDIAFLKKKKPQPSFDDEAW